MAKHVETESDPAARAEAVTAVAPDSAVGVSVTYPHLAPEIQARAALPDADRIALIRRGLVIEHPALQQALDYAAWLLSHPGGNLGRGMLLMGDSGSGKTTFGELLRATRSGGANGAGRLVMIDASGARTMREVYGRILQDLDGPVGRSTHTPDRELAVVRLLRALEVPALVVDEVQSIAEGSAKEQRRVLDGLKYLMNIARIPLLCLGALESERALVTDRHLAQRLAVFRLTPWRVDQGFVDFLASVQAGLPLRKPSQLLNEAVVRHLVEMSGGNLRPIMSVIASAAVRSILSGAECLTLKELQAATVVPSRSEYERLSHAK